MQKLFLFLSLIGIALLIQRFKNLPTSKLRSISSNLCQQCREAHSKPPLSQINYIIDPCLQPCSSIPCCPPCPEGSFCKACAAGSKPC